MEKILQVVRNHTKASQIKHVENEVWYKIDTIYAKGYYQIHNHCEIEGRKHGSHSPFN